MSRRLSTLGFAPFLTSVSLFTLAAVSGLGAGCSEPPPVTPLRTDVDVLIDAMGVPHLYAQTDEDAFFAAGYTMAKLRLFQIELVRRQAYGTASEILGEKALRGDLLARTVRFAEWGKKSREAVQLDDPRAAQLIEAWVRGINLHISRVRSGAAPRPVEMSESMLDFMPTAWSDEDPYVIGKMLSFGMSATFDYELLASALSKAAPSFPSDFPLCTPTRDAFTVPGVSPMPLRGSEPVDSRSRPSPRRLDEATRAQLTAALSRYERLIPETGSNNWAVAGKHTDTGRPMVCGDPHQPLGSPLRFYAQHINSRDGSGTLDVVGFGFTGTPGVQLGHNRRVAWTATTNYADVMDLWEVRRSDANAVLVGGKEQKAIPRTERIRVKSPTGPVAIGEGQGELREFALVDVPGFGVLLPDDLLPVPRAFFTTDPKAEILYNWTGLAGTHEASMYLGLDRSTTLDEWEKAARTLEVGAVNLIAADAKDIRYRVAANIPDRGDAHKQGIQPWRLMRGDDPKTLWRGHFLDESKLPSARSPERGYIATANNEPWGFTSDGRVDNDPFYYGYFYDPGDRGFRIESELKRLIERAKQPGMKLTAEDLKKLQLDARSTLADDLLPALGQAMAEIGTDDALKPYRNRPELFELWAKLSSWDRQMRRDSSEAVMFHAFSHFALKRGLSDDLGAFFGTLLQAEPAFGFKPLRLALRKVPGTTGLLQEGRNAVLVGGLADAADWLKQRFGAVIPTMEKPYAWRDVHAAGFDHPLGGSLSAGDFPVDGSIGTVNVSAASLFDPMGKIKDRGTAHAGSIYRMVTTFDEDGTPRAVVNFPRGNAEDPKSPFYSNTHQAWLDGHYDPLLYRRSEVEAKTVQRFTLTKEGVER
jgi:penicillin amidase